ncbi:hypothetical protein ALT_9274 [Aspergillus lentulus]|uniref:Uncharacterized protein n=1 Tax=Aspergillus lentulus TaxID=293939 RepID=A0AAN4PS01_ASPLE|nr:hypothetical protein ALT_9274 [Aspergillus lentulus]
MHALHPPSTPAIEDRSGELADRKGNIASLKAMLRVLVGPDHSKTCLMFEKNPESTDPDPASYLFENRGHLPQAKPCDQQSELCSRKIISRVQSWTNQCTGVAEGQSEAIIDSSNRLPMADEQTIKPDVCAWSDVLTSFEPGHGLSPDYYTCLTNIQTSHRPRQPEECITGPENHEQHDELKVNAPVQESAFCEKRTKPGNYPCGQNHASPGSSVATTDGPYTPIAGTCSATTPLHWSSSGQMMPWEMQSPEFEYRNSYFSQLRHHGGRVEAIPRNAALDACHGLPSVDCSQHYPQQPPFVLHPFTPREYNSTSIKDRSVVDEGHCQLTFTNDELTYPQHRYEIVESAHSTIASNGALGRRGRASSRSISCHNEARNAFLIECKRRGLSYKDIKRLGGFEEAESTLRGRFRTLTKSKEQRVRKPQWKDKDGPESKPRMHLRRLVDREV